MPWAFGAWSFANTSCAMIDGAFLQIHSPWLCHWFQLRGFNSLYLITQLHFRVTSDWLVSIALLIINFLTVSAVNLGPFDYLILCFVFIILYCIVFKVKWACHIWPHKNVYLLVNAFEHYLSTTQTLYVLFIRNELWFGLHNSPIFYFRHTKKSPISPSFC